jgi:RNA polymerase sigma factor (sigma-70 family)
MKQKYSDKEIISQLQEGDGRVIKHLVNEQLPVVSYYIIRNSGTEEDAKDIFQDALFILIKKLRDGNIQLISSFSTYLFAICKNLWQMVLDKRKAAQNYHSITPVSDIEDDLSEMSDQLIYEKIFMKSYQGMDDQCRTILRMYWKEISPEKIATTLDYSPGFLRKKKSQCMKEFKRRILNHRDFKELEYHLSN